MPRIVIENGPDKGRYVVVSPKTTVLIGRDTSSALPLHDTMASRMHFRVEPRDDSYWLVDLDSMNGTLLNGKPVKESKLAFGDLVKVGETLFSFVSDETAAGELTGQKIAGYRILERIGRGGMGTVYKAEQVDLQRIVALKVLSEEHGAEKEFIELFVHEARAAAKLNHPNVVQVYDVKRHGHLYFFSMEYLPNGSVQEILARERKIPVDRALGIMLDVARGIEYAHAKGIVHRDIKPDNVMIAEDGKAKLGDLGLARRLDEKVGPDENQSVIGTPHYIAPEQVLGKGADFRSDIYSLGATYYRMLTGNTPYTASSIRDLVNKKVREDPPPVAASSPEVPGPLAELVHKMMSRDPGQRHQKMSDVVADLEKIRREMAGLGGAEGTATTPIVVSNRRLLVAALAALLLVVVGGVVAAILMRKGPEPPPPGPPAASDDLAERMLQNAKAYEFNQMNRTDPDSIRRAIKEYQAVVEKYAGNEGARKFVEEAREAKARLEAALRGCLADRELADKWEIEDVANWQDIRLSFDKGRYDEAFKTLDRTIQNYHDFANRDDVRGTDAGAKARRREEHILRWKVEMERWKTEWGKLLAEVEPLEEQKQFREAWRLLADFEQKVAAAAMPCDFSKDRYRTFLFAYEAEARRKKLVARAEAEYYTLEAEVKKLLNDRNKSPEKYDALLRKLDVVVRGSTEDWATSATLLRRSLEEDLARWKKEEEDRAEKVRREQLRLERDLFEKSCREARPHVLAFRFKEALAVLKGGEGKIVGDPFGPRLARRIEELERAVAFKDGIAGAFKAGRLRKPPTYRAGSLEGTITEFTDAGFWVKLPDGRMEVSYASMPPAEFHRFVKDVWPKMEPEFAAWFAIVCMEFGLYEEAKKELAVVSETAKSNAGLKALADRYLAMIAEGEYTEFEEIEAAKRVARLKAFLQGGNYGAAKDEVDLLRRKYGRTETFQKSQGVIEDAIRKIGEKSGDEQKNKMKSERQKAIDQTLAASRNDAQRGQAEVITRLNRVPDEFERNWYLGEMYAAHGDWGRSTERWLEAKRIGDRWPLARDGSREMTISLMYVYLGLTRNAILRSDPAIWKAVRADAVRKFADERISEYWAAGLQSLEKWQQTRFKGASQRLDAYLREVRENPDDPRRIWQVAETISEDLKNPLEARGYYQFLLANHPDFEKVASGECLWRLAETAYLLKEIPDAMKLYRELQESHPDHRAVKGDEDTGESVEVRRKQCHQLAKKMGYDR